MPKMVLMEELHLTISVPVGLANARYQAMQKALRSQRFHARLREAVREVLGRYPSLKDTKLEISR